VPIQRSCLLRLQALVGAPEDADAVKKKSDNNVVPCSASGQVDGLQRHQGQGTGLKRGNEHASPKVEELVIPGHVRFTPKRADFSLRIAMRPTSWLRRRTASFCLRGECKLVLNVYKTAKTYKQFVGTLPSELARSAARSVKAFPGLIFLVRATSRLR
jgi:hypothetical protein